MRRREKRMETNPSDDRPGDEAGARYQFSKLARHAVTFLYDARGSELHDRSGPDMEVGAADRQAGGNNKRPSSQANLSVVWTFTYIQRE